ncbi:MAG: DUF11 domain-containing protein, partial [Actinomycetia bacterium]|nr:DUF11 domain-containing protein [Actinomycetes bacterium]
TDTLPAGVTFVSSSGCAEDPNGAPTCSLGSIAPGGSAQYTITVTVDAGTSGTITNSVQVAANEGDPWEDNNSTTEDTPVTAPQPEADLSITKIDSVDPVDPGGTLTYTITVANAGPATATGVVATDTLPAGVTFVSSSGCAEDPNGAPTCSLGSIAPGGSAQYTITVTVDAGTSGTITNNASVTATQVDPNLKDNSIGEDTEVRIIEQPPGRIVIVKDTVPDNAQDFSFTVTGDLTPSSFSLDDDADGTLSNTQSFDGVAEGTYTVTETSTPGYTTTIVCNDPNSNTTTSGSTATIRVDPEEAVTCTFTNTAAPPPPPDPRIDIEKATNGADADTPTGPVLTVGDPVAWTYEITNPGDVVLANVQVVDDNGTPGIPGDDFNPTFVAGDTTANGLLDPGETWTYAASGTAIAGQYANIATVTAQAPDQVPVYDADASHYMGTTPPPPPPAVCPGGTITFGGFKLLNQDHNNTVTAAYSSPAGTYDIRLYSRDSGHAAGVHPDQTAEQWLLDITLADGSVVTLGATADLAEALTAELTLSQNGVLLGADIVSLTARHARIGSTSDSVSPCVGLTRIGDPPPPSPTCQSNAVGFGGGKLINVDGRDVSPIAAFNLPAGNYRATLFSADAGHAPGVFPEQDSERWSAVITLADGNVVTLGPTADLAEGQTFAASLAADVAFGSPVVSVYARHARLGTSHDSIVPVCVHFAPHALADSSEGLADVGDE